MAKTLSNMLALGTQAPWFSLFDVINNETFNLQSKLDFNGTVIMFICNHCPYVKHINRELINLNNDFSSKRIQFIAINSNDITQYPEDSPENMREVAIQEGYAFPYLFDETQEVARSYAAACTPDFYLFDHNLILVYRGQLDDSRPGNHMEVNGVYLRTALNQLSSKQTITVEQKPSMGCNIKWKQ